VDKKVPSESRDKAHMMVSKLEGPAQTNPLARAIVLYINQRQTNINLPEYK
jgi:hypothetical protein